MKVLVINSGSSSLKYQLFDMSDESVLAKGNCEKIGLDGSFISYKANGQEHKIMWEMKEHSTAMEKVLSLLTDSEIGVISSLDEVDAFGHRVVHGGEIYDKSVLVDDSVIKNLTELFALAPLHNPANVEGILACQKLSNKPNVVVCDSAFHATMPDYAYMYGLPMYAYTDWKIRKYGAHGTSHRYVSNLCAEKMGKDIKDLKIITVHLGNGSSMCAVDGGKSIDTTMGFTPLDGLVMGTRCGSLDASVLDYISTKSGMSLSEINTWLNKKCGMLGLNGVTSDSRDNNKLIEDGNKGAKLFIDMLVYEIKKYIGSYITAMGGVDAIVFTGGMGENQEELRELSLKGLEFLGIEIDVDKNNTLPRGTDEIISTPNSKVKVFRLPTNEELVIARDCVTICK